jgi:hypothetical protein
MRNSCKTVGNLKIISSIHLLPHLQHPTPPGKFASRLILSLLEYAALFARLIANLLILTIIHLYWLYQRIDPNIPKVVPLYVSRMFVFDPYLINDAPFK